MVLYFYNITWLFQSCTEVTEIIILNSVIDLLFMCIDDNLNNSFNYINPLGKTDCRKLGRRLGNIVYKSRWINTFHLAFSNDLS